MSLQTNRKKNFLVQESLLTNIFKTRSGKFFLSLYCLTFGFYLSSCVGNYYIDPDVGRIELEFISSGFHNLLLALGLWSVFHGILIIIFYPLTQIWLTMGWSASVYIAIGSVCLPCLMLISSTVFCFAITMGILSKVFISMEAVRLSMKIISFTTEIGNHLRNHYRTPDENLNGFKHINLISRPTLSHFCYFLFCPTAIYRSSYPLAPSRNFTRIFFYILLLLSLTFVGLKLAVATSAHSFKEDRTSLL